VTRVGIRPSVREGQAAGHGDSRSRDANVAAIGQVVSADRCLLEKSAEVTPRQRRSRIPHVSRYCDKL